MTRSESSPSPAKVSVIGLGPMGSVLARTLNERDVEVTVWNRTAARADPLVDAGCSLADSPAEAVKASPITIVNVLHSDVVAELLDDEAMTEAMSGRVIVDLSTGSPASCRALAETVGAAGGTYLGGGIMAYPRTIGDPDAVILYSGDRATFDAHADTLSKLAGSQRFVGEGPSDACGLFLACWNFYYGGLGGWLEAAGFASSIGVSVSELLEMTPVMIEQLTGGTADAARRIESSEFDGDQATIESYVVATADLVKTARQEGADPGMLEAFGDHCRKAADEGFGEKDLAVIFEVIRRRES